MFVNRLLCGRVQRCCSIKLQWLLERKLPCVLQKAPFSFDWNMGSWEVVIAFSTATWKKNFCSVMVKMTFPFPLFFPLLVYRWSCNVFICPGQGAGEGWGPGMPRKRISFSVSCAPLSVTHPVCYCLDFLLAAFSQPLGFSCQSPDSFFYPFLLSKQKMKCSVRWLG